MNQINNLARHTRLLEIVGDTVRVRAEGRAFGEMAVVENTEGGAKVRLVGEQLEIDLSDKAISKMLAAHLLPRFHALLTAAE